MNKMITFPDGLVPLRGLAGYFYDENNKKLYSIKIGGVLREMKLQKMIPMPNFNHYQGFYGWRVSVNGYRKCIPINDISKYVIRTKYTIPYMEKLENE